MLKLAEQFIKIYSGCQEFEITVGKVASEFIPHLPTPQTPNPSSVTQLKLTKDGGITITTIHSNTAIPFTIRKGNFSISEI